MHRGQSKGVALLAAACTVGLAAFAVVTEAEAAKGGASKLPTAGKAKANPSQVVRDHRGAGKVLSPPPRCAYYHPQPGCINRPWRGFPKGATFATTVALALCPKRSQAQNDSSRSTLSASASARCT